MWRALCLLPASRSAASLTIDYNFCLILSKLPAPSQSGWEVFYFRRSNFPVSNKENFQKKGERGKCLKHCDEDYKFYCDKYLLPGFKNKDRRTTN